MTIQEAWIKGAPAIVTGISDALAETIMDLRINEGGIETVANFQTGLWAVLAKVERRIQGQASRGLEIH